MKSLLLALGLGLLLCGCQGSDSHEQIAHDQAFFRQHPIPSLKMTATSGSFVLPLLPDTQFYAENNHRELRLFRTNERYSGLPYEPALAFFAQTTWLARNAAALQVPMVVHLGDVVQNAGTLTQWQIASGAMRVLEEGGVPYSIMSGDRDIHGATTPDDERSFRDRFKDHFGPQRAAWQSTYGGSDPLGLSQFHLFRMHEQPFLLLALDWSPSRGTLAWAQQVIDEHPHVPVILASHNILYRKGSESPQLSREGNESGPLLWEQLIRRNDQIFLTVSGHVEGSAHARMLNDLGHSVDMVMVDYQDEYLGGNGLLQLLEFDLRRNRIDALSVSPWVLWKRQVYPRAFKSCASDQSLRGCDQLFPAPSSGWDNRFRIDIDFRARFAGFQGYVAQLPEAEAQEASLLEQLQEQLESAARTQPAAQRDAAKGDAKAGKPDPAHL
ncbi:calcineurin [Pseudomonas sp. ZM23]|uniref:Calcineurin n=1 Tax=Pseudomonas triclosanedens TaxID=2961893 RepID=A0ABY6ZXQ5_9PSED|nr:calcineurin [Pseudomonas triclosanedens]MCP8465137.1 calcineurin [Pseudomonas triclosanedens]MCP8470923.1 calcineurin [Pseudomonas triclosanedens]MCP8476437.1 calcineurin [Pseudomonas triclosanedens]WAI49106.1 calcineurin [Pseudomonas triclosanedens]